MRAWFRDKRREEDIDALISGLNWCTGSRAPCAADSVPTPRQDLVTARVRESVGRSLPTFAIPGQRVTLLKLQRGRGVCGTRDGGLSLASFIAVSPRVEAVVLRSRQEISEMNERLGDHSLASNRGRHLQLVRALLKRDMVIEVGEVRQHAGVFLVEKQGKDTHWLIIDRCECQQPAFLASTWSQFGDLRGAEPC